MTHDEARAAHERAAARQRALEQEYRRQDLLLRLDVYRAFADMQMDLWRHLAIRSLDNTMEIYL